MIGVVEMGTVYVDDPLDELLNGVTEDRGYEQDNDRARVHRPAMGAGKRLYLSLRIIPGQKIHGGSRFKRRHCPKALCYHFRASLGSTLPTSRPEVDT
jgi:hypothetical protein